MRDTPAPPAAARRALLAPLVGLLLLAATAESAPPGAPPIEAVERDLVNLLQGETVQAKSSAALCRPAEKGPYGGDDRALLTWYFDERGCELPFAGRPAALITSVSEGGGKVLFESPAELGRLNSTLDALRSAVARGGLGPQQKLLVHSRAWEVAFGLGKSLQYHPEWRSAAAPSVKRALAILEATQFSPQDLAGLDGRLADLPRQAKAPEIEDAVRGLLNRDPGFVEVVPPTDLHADILLGRFTPRIFLTVSDAAQRPKLAEFTRASTTTYGDLINLPRTFAGVRGILVLYFNVFAADGTIVPTDTVAFWQEYTFGDKVAAEMPFTEAARRLSFLVVEPVQDWSSGELRYEVADQQRMSRRAFLDVKPKIAGMPATTLRAHCLFCHRNQVATFDTHGERRVQMAVPFQRSGRELLTPFYERFETQLRDAKRRYAQAP